MPHQGTDPPIRTWAVVIEACDPRVFKVRAPNGKVSYGHLNRGFHPKSEIGLGDEVLMEFSAFDMDRGRIVESRESSTASNS